MRKADGMAIVRPLIVLPTHHLLGITEVRYLFLVASSTCEDSAAKPAASQRTGNNTSIYTCTHKHTHTCAHSTTMRIRDRIRVRVEIKGQGPSM